MLTTMISPRTQPRNPNVRASVSRQVGATGIVMRKPSISSKVMRDRWSLAGGADVMAPSMSPTCGRLMSIRARDGVIRRIGIRPSRPGSFIERQHDLGPGLGRLVDGADDLDGLAPFAAVDQRGA